MTLFDPGPPSKPLVDPLCLCGHPTGTCPHTPWAHQPPYGTHAYAMWILELMDKPALLTEVEA